MTHRSVSEKNAAEGDPAEENSAEERGESKQKQKQSAMTPRVKASLLWGAIGVLGFLVLVQGYELWTGFRYSLAVKAGVTLVVGLGATGLSYAAEPRLFGE